MERKVTGSLLFMGLLLVAAVGLFVGGPRPRVVTAQPATPANQFLTVTGEAFVALRPDHIRLEVAVPLLPESPANSLDPVARVTAALRANGVAKDDIRTLRTDLEYRPPGGEQGATALLEVTLRDLDPAKLAEVTGAVAGQGGRVVDARYVAQRRDQAESQAVSLAMKDALAKAKVLAGAAGGTLGRVRSIESQPVVEEGLLLTASPALTGLAGSALPAPPAPARGDVYGLRSRVNVTYEMR